MAIFLSDELRLLYAIALNAIPFLCAYRFARRWTADRLIAAGDAFLLYYAIQYIAICLPGVAGVLYPLSIALAALAQSIALLLAASPLKPAEALSRRDQLACRAAGAFVIGFLAALINHQKFLPITSNDALTYHLPAAVQWLQTHRLGLYEAWFYNPANTYSPLAGSAFVAWLIAPVGNDIIARFVAAPPLLFAFIGVLNVCRAAGLRTAVTATLAAAAVLSRPFMSQTILAKDDLFVVGFFLWLIVGLTPMRLGERFAPWRIGIALGLLLATKYTALFALPILVLMIDTAARAGWRPIRWGIAIGCALLLAGPWYGRNWILTGNPLYPTDVRFGGLTIFPGMFHAARSHLLETPHSAWRVFVNPGGYYAMPAVITWPLIALWIAAAGLTFRRLLSDPLVRAIILGPPLAILAFIFTSPYGEMRFAYPAIILLFAAVGLALTALPSPLQLPIAAMLALTAALTAFRIQWTWQFILAGCCVAAVAVLWAGGLIPLPLRRLATAAAALGLGALVYVQWVPAVRDYRETWTYDVWPQVYGPQAELWRFVREEVPPGATIAYANTYFTYPLMGFAYDHPVLYVPTRHDLNRFIDMPRIGRPITGEEIPGEIVRLLREEPDGRQWLERLLTSGAGYLVVFTKDPANPSQRLTPPELAFAQADPARFVRCFQSEEGSVFQIRPDPR